MILITIGENRLPSSAELRDAIQSRARTQESHYAPGTARIGCSAPIYLAVVRAVFEIQSPPRVGYWTRERRAVNQWAASAAGDYQPERPRAKSCLN